MGEMRIRNKTREKRMPMILDRSGNDKNSLLDELNIRKKELNAKQKGRKELK
jgi:hypothetical protein